MIDTNGDRKVPYFSKTKSRWGWASGCLDKPSILPTEIFRLLPGAQQNSYWADYLTKEAAEAALITAQEKYANITSD